MNVANATNTSIGYFIADPNGILRSFAVAGQQPLNITGQINTGFQHPAYNSQGHFFVSRFVVDGPAKYAILMSPPNKLDQAVTFGPLPDKKLGDAPFNVLAQASSGLPVSFTASGGCTVSGG